MAQIEVEHLVKQYQRKKNPKNLAKALGTMFHPEYEYLRAVDDIGFTVEKGEAVGYVGPNGSGKSTTIKMLCGILTPTEGTVKVNGIEPSKERIKNNRNIGVVFGNRSMLWWDVPVIESYRLLQKMYEIPKARFDEKIEKFKDIMGIGSLLDVPERQLSLGQKMRCNIAAAFLHDPQIVYLDEPTIGLDTQSKQSIRECIQKMNEEEETTFVVTSHDFQDIEMLCRRIILINHGKVILDDEMNKVRHNFDKIKKIKFEVDKNPWYGDGEFQMDGVTVSGQTAYNIALDYDVSRTDSISIIHEVSERCEIQDIVISGRDIETIIRDVLRENERQGK